MLFAAHSKPAALEMNMVKNSPFFSCSLKNEADTARLAQALASVAKAGDLIALFGDLGAGKSTFARSFIRSAFGDPLVEVPSPTFTLVQSYEPPQGPDILHADLYRLSGPEDVEDLGLEDERTLSILLIEWPDRLPDEWQTDMLAIEFLTGEAETSRIVNLRSGSAIWPQRLLAALEHAFEGLE
jgi:tRNA threonylcarbamoyl adenosine modification protein YjeE